jgi:clan AA aspartic protease
VIEGHINDDEAIVPLHFVSSDGHVIEFKVIVDTGFSGFLALPLSAILALHRPRTTEETVDLADGSTVTVPGFRLEIIWAGKKRRVMAYGMDGRPLIGMKLLRGHLVTMEVMPDGLITIEPAN